jgi:aconitate hydratase
MGVLPLQFAEGDSASSLGLTGRETYAVGGIAAGIEPGQDVAVTATADDGTQTAFAAKIRIDGAAEVEYFRHGGILPMVLREMLASSS